jgi:hypothetical protein
MNHATVPVPVSDSCLNCGTRFSIGQKFCGACGQRTDIDPQLTMRDIGHDLVHAITHADHSVFALVRSMLTRPGHVARDFVAGKRKRHFGPFAFLLITVGLASAAILLFGVEWFSPFEHGPPDDILQQHVNLVILLQAPLLAAFCAALFFAEGRSFADHLVLAAYTTGFHALFLALVETPLLALTRADTTNPWLAGAYLGAWFAYFAFAASQFYEGRRPWSAFKGLIAALLSQATIVACIMALLYFMTNAGRP